MLSSENKQTPQSKALARQKGSFRSFNFQDEEKQLTSLQTKKIQICSRGNTEFRKPNNPRQDKIKKGGSQILKFEKNVAAAIVTQHILCCTCLCTYCKAYN